MDKASSGATVTCHVVAMPFPGRGHINPMMNFCKLIASARPDDIIITFIVTEEWHGFLSSDTRPANLRLTTIPNVIPSEIGRGKDWPGFLRATWTKLEAPVEQLLDRFPLPKPKVIIYDTYLNWVVDLGNRRNIPVASFWTQSATVFSIFLHSDLIVQNGHFNANLAEKGNEEVKYIPGVSSLRLADLPTPICGRGQEVLPTCLESISLVSKAQYLLFSSTHEFETEAIDNLRKTFSIPVYSIGPAIPHFKLDGPSPDLNEPEYFKWLDAQPKNSVLFISQGSFLSASSAQLDEIIAGVYDSGVRFFWVTREDSSPYQKKGDASKGGLVVPWCDQLRVLCHSSLGGFWSHCGWNSTKEAIFSGLPVLCFPIFWDQPTNAKQIVEDWKFGWRVKRDDETMVTRKEIARRLQRFMDLETDEGKEMRRRARELQKICQEATEKGGSSSKDLEAFLQDIFQSS